VYDGELPLERIRAELFNAGESWVDALTAPGMARFVGAVVAAHAELETSLAQATDTGQALHDWAARARQEAVAQGSPVGAAIGERALVSTLLRTITTSSPLADLRGERAAQAWRETRGEPATLAQRYLGAVLEQFTRHVVARDMGRLVAEGRSSRDTRELTRKLGRAARDVADALPAREATSADAWASYVREAFEHGRTLPR
jgi:hypothetical protein